MAIPTSAIAPGEPQGSRVDYFLAPWTDLVYNPLTPPSTVTVKECLTGSGGEQCPAIRYESWSVVNITTEVPVTKTAAFAGPVTAPAVLVLGDGDLAVSVGGVGVTTLDLNTTYTGTTKEVTKSIARSVFSSVGQSTVEVSILPIRTQTATVGKPGGIVTLTEAVVSATPSVGYMKKRQDGGAPSDDSAPAGDSGTADGPVYYDDGSSTDGTVDTSDSGYTDDSGSPDEPVYYDDGSSTDDAVDSGDSGYTNDSGGDDGLVYYDDGSSADEPVDAGDSGYTDDSSSTEEPDSADYVDDSTPTDDSAPVEENAPTDDSVPADDSAPVDDGAPIDDSAPVDNGGAVDDSVPSDQGTAPDDSSSFDDSSPERRSDLKS
ncbi:MAG: hypothetical protein Q9160_003870 [Pyrenula sp. 1 TL-2023]